MSDPDAHRPVIYVDADSCPVKAEICQLATQGEVDAVFVASCNHEIANTVTGVEVVTVDNEPEAADIAIANRLAKGDIVITQDFGLAAMCLGRGAHALSPRGVVYDNGNIDRLARIDDVSVPGDIAIAKAAVGAVTDRLVWTNTGQGLIDGKDMLLANPGSLSV